MSHENSKTAKALNTRCSRCNRVLVDAVSVEKEMGPVCRDKNHVSDEVPVSGSQVFKAVKELSSVGDENLRVQVLNRIRKGGTGEAVNKLVHEALNSEGLLALKIAKVVQTLGFHRVAKKLESEV